MTKIAALVLRQRRRLMTALGELYFSPSMTGLGRNQPPLMSEKRSFGGQSLKSVENVLDMPDDSSIRPAAMHCVLH